jgi:hypothetical protein
MVRRDVSGVGLEVEAVLVAVAVVAVGIGAGPEVEVEVEAGIHGRKGLILVAWRKRQARQEPK